MTTFLDADALDLATWIRPGDAVVVGQGLAEPLTLTETLVRQREKLGLVDVFIGPLFSSTFAPEHEQHLRFSSWCGTGANHRFESAGALDILPANYSDIAPLFARGKLASDVVFLLLSEDGEGGFNTGLANDYLIDAARRARTVIAEISDRVPWTFGADLPRDLRIDVAIRTSREPLTIARAPGSDAERKMAERVAALVPDGATLEIGVGSAPDLVLAALAGHRNLGFHSGVISDGAVELIKKGVLTNACKPFDRGVSVGGVLMGSRALYEFAHRNRGIRLAPASHTHDARVVSCIPNFMAINAAVEVDLTGQANGELANGRYIGAIGGQGDFTRAANLSEGGRAVVMLSSTTGNGVVSRIVGRLGDGIVSVPRCDADTVVSEWGVAELRGATLRQRIARMCAIADPRFREDLERQGHEILAGSNRRTV
jgi:acyl-CoA hydrolase